MKKAKAGEISASGHAGGAPAQAARDRPLIIMDKQPCFAQRLTSTSGVLEVSIVSTALIDESGQMYGVAAMGRINPGNTAGQAA